MKKTKRFLALLIALVLFSGLLAACGEKKEPQNTKTDTGSAQEKQQSGSAAQASGGTLTVYSTETDELLNMLIPSFEKETGIKVEIVTANTGEILKRIESEADNPIADVMLGGTLSVITTKEGVFEEYVSPEDEFLYDDYRNTLGFTTIYKTEGSVLLVNKDLAGDIEIKGYKDLLNPALKGKIAMGDAASSSSAYQHLLNMLKVMSPDGKNESDEAWDYVQELLYNVDGKVLNSSSAVHKGVVEGEYVVGLTYGDPAFTYVKDGANVEVVMMEEGCEYTGSCVSIVKNAKNLENAKKLVDYILSEEIQQKLAQDSNNYPVRQGVESGGHMMAFDEINRVALDYKWASEEKTHICEKFTDLVTNVE